MVRSGTMFVLYRMQDLASSFWHIPYLKYRLEVHCPSHRAYLKRLAIVLMPQPLEPFFLLAARFVYFTCSYLILPANLALSAILPDFVPKT